MKGNAPSAAYGIKRSSIKKSSARAVSSTQNKGYEITRIKPSSLLAKMKLKKGDIVLSIEKQPVKSKKQAYQILSPILKTKKELSIVVSRGSKEIRLSYRILPYKNKKKLVLSKIEKISFQKAKAGQNKSGRQTKKKSLVPKKYKPYMQRAYVSSLNSFVYKKPDFDSTKLYPLPIGRKILISKKIFRPPHNFGTFYKVFLFKEKKVVGYISEAEVIPEFKRKEKAFNPNPSYKVAKQYISDNKILNLDSIEEIKKSAEQPKARQGSKQKNNRKKYVGLSSGLMTTQLSSHFPREDWFIGLKLSGYNLLISYLNMDINLTSAFNWRKFYMDILVSYPALSSSHYYLFLVGGLMGSLQLDKDYIMSQESIDYGPAGALSLLVPLNKNIVFRLDAKTAYEIRNRSLTFGGSAGLQVAF